MIKHIKGDLIDAAKSGRLDIVAHGCNCFHTMGGGVAKAIAEAFPAAKIADQLTVYADDRKLGTYSIAFDPRYNLTILNLYTQYKYSKSSADQFEYDHFKNICQSINATFAGKKIGFPKIGSGLANGDWFKILKIMQDNLSYLDVTIVEL